MLNKFMAILDNELVTQVVSDVECSNCGDPSSAFCEQCYSHYCKHCSLLMHKHPKRKRAYHNIHMSSQY